MQQIKVDPIQVMPEEFISTMAVMYKKGGEFYFDTFDKWLDWMYVESCGGLRFKKMEIKNDV
jgi:hypothetical protein